MNANDIPARYPPPFEAESVIAKSTFPPDRQLPVGVLIVGAGPAGLACAIRLMQLLEKEPELKTSLGDFPVAVLEKGKYPGAHLLSGAVINPVAFRKLFPNLKDSDFPFYGPVEKESVYFLTSKKAFPIPVPPTMKNHGNFSASLAKVGAWMAGKAEELGVTLLPQTSAVKLLVEEGTVKGVATGNKGVDRDGKPLSNFEEGVEMLSKVTVLAEGTGGYLTQSAIHHFKIEGVNPQIYALGVKEIWEVSKPLDGIIHTMGWP